MNQTTTRRFGRASIPIVLVLMASVLFAAPAHGQDATTDDEAAFLATVTEAREASQGRIDAPLEAGFTRCVGLATEACLQDHLAPDLEAAADELASYAALLGDLDVPARFAGDVATHITNLERTVDALLAARDAAAVVDEVALQAAFATQADLDTKSIAGLDREYVEAAFVGFGNRDDLLNSFSTLTPEEEDYLAAARRATRAAASNFECFGEALQEVYGDTATLMGALSRCGAGDAVAKIETAAGELVPAGRFIDDHEWWLASLAEQVRYDRRIGQAAAAGDVISFLVDNARAVLAGVPDASIDRTFLGAIGGGPPVAPLAANEPLARTVYGRELHAALAAYSDVNPFLVLQNSIAFPHVPRPEALAAITELAAEVRDLNAPLLSAVVALTPPPELVDDHAAIVAFFEEYDRGIEALIDAAATGDAAATFAIENESISVFCEASASFSDEIRPAAKAFFDAGRPPFC